MNYCSNCGGKVVFEILKGDDRPRYACHACGTIHYQNPRIVVGTIPELDGKILLCRRAIDPCLGKWTLPAGYLENGETLADGALRETREEAGALVEIVAPYALFNICHIHQVYFMFRARMKDQNFKAGHESSAVALFSEAEIPWEEIAFRVIETTLREYFKDRPRGKFPFRIEDIPPLQIE